MATDAFVEHCLELLAPLGAPRAKRMFGGHGLYVDDVFVGLILFDRLFLKTDASSRSRFEAAGCEPFVYSARGRPVTVSAFWSAPAEAMESPAQMTPWARLAFAAALAARHAKTAPKLKARAAPAAKRASASRR